MPRLKTSSEERTQAELLERQALHELNPVPHCREDGLATIYSEFEALHHINAFESHFLNSKQIDTGESNR